ncbi:MAG: hypothetical protein L6R38_006888 [Xanthoria sp. 2 TBL-2021]|nr:MAG: hypothetical protein L6R38_006888 [Xanthoria sp. 2 TBL-2021]
MGAADVIYYTFHIQELRSIVQWKIWHHPVHERDPEKESVSLRVCFEFLDQTSRSFSAVIQELHPELLVPIALFYLILRGLDTIEDDMTIPIEKKDPLLRDFHTINEKEGWSFNGSGPDEKDRELLVQFHYVTEEYRKIKPVYREIINDITRKMGAGMADYCNKAAEGKAGVETVEEYDEYCYYVAGLVGHGLTQLFIESGLANAALKDRPELQKSMGLFLQKTNVIRDIKEDWDDKRRFWPREIWSKYVDNFEDLLKPANQEAALNCSSEMVLNSLNHADECLFYLAGLKEQSVFNFAAIPQAMAIATLALVFRNPDIFKKNVKMTKGSACQTMLDSTQNLSKVCEVFRKFVRHIHKKNTPKDPNFLKISIACGKVEQFIESIFPSQNPQALVRQEAPETEEQKKEREEAKWDIIYMLMFVMGALFILSVIMLGIAWFVGARFDLAITELKDGNWRSLGKDHAQKMAAKYDRGEL